MTEERLKEIADSISLQEQVMEAYGQDMLLVEEEKELYNEVIRLKKVLRSYGDWLEDQIDFNEDSNNQDYLCAIYSIAYCKLQEFKEIE